jgi:transcriptional regulator with XRE-family HTH domain
MASELRARLGAKLLVARDHKGWSRSHAANKAGVDSGVVRRIELGQNYKVDALESYAGVLGRSLEDWLWEVLTELRALRAFLATTTERVYREEEVSPETVSTGAADSAVAIIPSPLGVRDLNAREQSAATYSSDLPQSEEERLYLQQLRDTKARAPANRVTRQPAPTGSSPAPPTGASQAVRPASRDRLRAGRARGKGPRR